jgi:hypothetical protein
MKKQTYKYYKNYIKIINKNKIIKENKNKHKNKNQQFKINI